MSVSSFNSLLYALYAANDRKAAVYAFSRSKDGDFDSMVCNNTVEIAGYRGKAAELALPEKINGLPVVAIGAAAFTGNQLTGVTIPGSVAIIGDSAFAYNQLTGVTIPGSVTAIGDSAFAYNQLTGVTISDSVTAIGGNAFEGNQLTNVIIPGSVAVIGDYAFWENQLTNVTIPANVNVVGDPFPGNLADVYTSGGSRAGTYRSSDGGRTWVRQ
jgi:hypothetical protein